MVGFPSPRQPVPPHRPEQPEPARLADLVWPPTSRPMSRPVDPGECDRSIRASVNMQATVNVRKARQAATIRPASFDDYHQIASLESRYGIEPRTYSDWTHLWLGNPVYRELHPDWNIGWVVEDNRKQIVGSVGNVPLQ